MKGAYKGNILFVTGSLNIQNSLPNYVIEADSISSFKNRLDNKHWANQDIVLKFNSEL